MQRQMPRGCSVLSFWINLLQGEMSTFISPMKKSTKRRPINHIISCPLSRKRRTNKPVTFEIRTWRWPFRGEIPSSCSVFARQQLSRFRGSGFSVFLSLSLSLSLFIYLSMSPCLCISLSPSLSLSGIVGTVKLSPGLLAAEAYEEFEACL